MNPFSIGGTLASLQAKLILAGLIVLVCLGVYLKMKSDGKEIVELKVANVVSGKIVAEQKEIIRTDAVVAEIREVTNTAIAVEVKKVEKKHRKIEAVVEKKIADIEQKFEELPKTPENSKAEHDQLSQTNISSVWEAFCAADPNANECPTPPPQGDVNV
jgi:hypothetical protein